MGNENTYSPTELENIKHSIEIMMKKYIEYTQEKATNLATMEYQKNEFKKSLVIEKEDKDNTILSYSSLQS